MKKQKKIVSAHSPPVPFNPYALVGFDFEGVSKEMARLEKKEPCVSREERAERYVKVFARLKAQWRKAGGKTVGETYPEYFMNSKEVETWQ